MSVADGIFLAKQFKIYKMKCVAIWMQVIRLSRSRRVDCHHDAKLDLGMLNLPKRPVIGFEGQARLYRIMSD